jgi:hypothetical protein
MTVSVIITAILVTKPQLGNGKPVTKLGLGNHDGTHQDGEF